MRNDTQTKQDVYQKFRQALIQMINDKDNITSAYKASRHNCDKSLAFGPLFQRKLIKNYNKLHDSGIEPIDKSIRRFKTMTGITFMHDGTTDTIDFENPANARYKKLFDQAFDMMTMHARVYEKERTELKVTQQGSNFTIAPSYCPGFSIDPLSNREIPLTMTVVRYIRENNPDAHITIQTEHELLLKKDPNTGDALIYMPFFSEKQDDAEPLCRINDSTSVRFNTIMRKDYGVYGKLGRHVSRIDIDILEKNPDDIMSAVTYDTDENTPSNPSRTPPYLARTPINFLTEYARIAKTKADGDTLMVSMCMGPDTGRERLLENFSAIRNQVLDATPEDVKAKSIGAKIPVQDIDKMTAAYMSSTAKSGTKFYPICDRTNPYDQKSTKIIAFAKVNTTANAISGILHMDDPEAKAIYDDIRDELSKKISGMTMNQKQSDTTAPDTKSGTQAQTGPATPAKEPTTTEKRLNAFALMNRYGSQATTKKKGDAILQNAGIDPEADHDKMANDIQNLARSAKKKNQYELIRIAMQDHLSQKSTKDVGGYLSTLLRQNMRRDAYYPILDKTQDRYDRKKLIAIAAVDKSTWTVNSVIRADDPEIKPAIDDLAKFVTEKLNLASEPEQKDTPGAGMDIMAMREKARIDGLGPIPGPSRHIPDNQKPDFMLRETTENDRQYD